MIKFEIFIACLLVFSGYIGYRIAIYKKDKEIHELNLFITSFKKAIRILKYQPGISSKKLSEDLKTIFGLPTDHIDGICETYEE